MIDTDFLDWLDAHADALDSGECSAESIVPRLGAAGLLKVGVPPQLGGSGGTTTTDVLELIAAVAERSVTAAFVLWGQRVFIEYLLHTPNDLLRTELLPALLEGDLAGATGLSNAMKFLSGIEELHVSAQAVESGYRLSGRLPWVTNLRKQGFVVACAADHGLGHGASVFAIPHSARGLVRSPDLDLIALRSSDTAALSFDRVELDERHLLHPEATQFLQAVRPTFLAYQSGLALGLARASLRHAREATGSARSVLADARLEQEHALTHVVRDLSAGLQQRSFASSPARLFELRLRLIEIATASVGIELMSRGGKAYIHGSTGFARRWREASFLPIVTPSVVQLRAEMTRHAVRSDRAFARASGEESA